MAIDKGCDYLPGVFWSPRRIRECVLYAARAEGQRERWLRGRDERTGECI